MKIFKHESETYSLQEKLIQINKSEKFNNAVILMGGAGCYPKGTEFFSQDGWKAIEDYQKGDTVLQVNHETFESDEILPQDYIDLPVNEFIRIKNKDVDFVTSIDHKHLVLNDVTQKKEILRTHELMNLDYSVSLITDLELDVEQEKITEPFACISREFTTYEKVETSEDERMYCFTVPTGFFLVRQNNKIYVSGNSGKGFVSSKMTNIKDSYMIFDVDYLKQVAMAMQKKFGKYPEIADIVKDKNALKDPENVTKLHMFIKNSGLQKKLVDNKLTNMFANMTTKDRKPNLLFDKTGKNITELRKTIDMVKGLGYDSENIHIIWVFSEFAIASKRNSERDRKVYWKVLAKTHRGASLAMSEILTSARKDFSGGEFDGEIYIVNGSKTEIYDISPNAKKENTVVVKDFQYIQIKKSGQPIDFSDKEKESLIAWYRKNSPRSVRGQLELVYDDF